MYNHIIACSLFCFISLDDSAPLSESSQSSGKNSDEFIPVVFLSLDGFRWDYLNKYGADMPTFTKLIQEGSTVEKGLLNAFITKTFPNHRTLITGLWEESHGIVANSFWDPNLKKEFSKGVVDIEFWNEAIPLWKVAENNGISSGCFQYPGCNVKEQMPTYILSEEYIPDLSFTDLVDNASRALKHPENPAKFITMYFSEPDETGHQFGPESNEMNEKLKELDGNIAYMLEKLGSDINLILTSDHGMSQFKTGLNTTKLVSSLDPHCNHIFNNKVEIFVWPKLGKLEEVRNILNKFVADNPQVRIHFKEHFLPRWHYKLNNRIAPIMLFLPDGMQFSEELEAYERGQHGYDNLDANMRPIFIAKGPAFKKNFSVTSEEISNVDIYPLVCHLLNFEPLPNNGSLKNLSSIMADSELVSKHSEGKAVDE